MPGLLWVATGKNTQAQPATSTPVTNSIANLPPLPAGLKPYLVLGLGNIPGSLNWMKNSGTPWDARYTYLAGGVNTGNGWETWQWDQLPPGQYALDYMNDSSTSNYFPAFTYYDMLQSAPGNSRGDLGELQRDMLNLTTPATMSAYYQNFKLLMQKTAQYNKPVIIHVEPDLWGYMQLTNANPNNVAASVKSSGFGEVAAFENNAGGFAKALVALRNTYAPKVLLAYHISPWSNTVGDLGTDNRANFNVTQAAQETANFYLQLGANFDLMFYDVADRDAAYRELVLHYATPWWDVTNTTFPNANRFHQFAGLITQATNKRGFLWQVPVGNTVYCTMNNTPNHYQDNRPEYYLANNNTHLQDLADAGIVGILFGPGQGDQTTYEDVQTGISNPRTTNCTQSTLPDDDGGFLRLNARAYYNRGTVPVAGFAKFSASLNPGSTIQLKSAVGYATSYDFKIYNLGDAVSSLSISSPVLTVTGSAQITVTPATGFNLTANAGKDVRISCTPQATGLQAATLSYTTNDANRPSVSYTIQCTGLSSRIVTKVSDSGAGTLAGTLSFALTNGGNSAQEAVVFELESGNTINVTGLLPPVPTNLTLDGGGCTNGQPRIIINGSQAGNVDGLRLQSGSTLRNLQISGFVGRQLQLLAGAKQLKFDHCVKVIQS